MIFLFIDSYLVEKTENRRSPTQRPQDRHTHTLTYTHTHTHTHIHTHTHTHAHTRSYRKSSWGRVAEAAGRRRVTNVSPRRLPQQVNPLGRNLCPRGFFLCRTTRSSPLFCQPSHLLHVWAARWRPCCSASFFSRRYCGFPSLTFDVWPPLDWLVREIAFTEEFFVPYQFSHCCCTCNLLRSCPRSNLFHKWPV